jgi:hypothetical protein
LILHDTVPRVFSHAHPRDSNGLARLIGALEAAALAVLAMAFARALALRGAAALATAAVVFFGGYLALLTGYSKAFCELCVLIAFVGAAGVRVVREGRGLVAFNAAIAVAFLLHRSALGLLPVLIVVWWIWLRAAGSAAWRKPATIAALALPALALAAMGPRIVATILKTDAVHFTPYEVQHGGGVLRAAFAGTRTVDLLNLVLLLSPLALALRWCHGRPPRPRCARPKRWCCSRSRCRSCSSPY